MQPGIEPETIRVIPQGNQIFIGNVQLVEYYFVCFYNYDLRCVFLLTLSVSEYILVHAYS